MPVYTLASVILLKVNKLTNQVHILTLGLYSLARSHYFVCIFRIKFEKIIIIIGDNLVITVKSVRFSLELELAKSYFGVKFKRFQHS